ncbi:MAG: hypothetical protein ABL967_03410 [Bryobacteraceae bacterium]
MLLILMILFSSPIFAADFCAIKVSIKSPAGVPIRTGVALRQSNGEGVENKISSSEGKVEFCDIGLGLYDLVVGPNLCGQVIVRHLFQIWPDEREVTVTYENCHSFPLPSGCIFLLRIRASDELPVVGAIVRQKDSTTVTDGFGRAFLNSKATETTVQIEREGFESSQIKLFCDPMNSDRETIVVLRRSSTSK